MSSCTESYQQTKAAIEHPERYMAGPWAKYTWPTGGMVIDLEAFRRLPKREQQRILNRIPKNIL